MTRPYLTTAKQRAASARWYAKNRRRHIAAVQDRYRARREAAVASGPAPVTVAEIRAEAARRFGTVAEVAT